jgi:hypothetical protein
MRKAEVFAKQFIQGAIFQFFFYKDALSKRVIDGLANKFVFRGKVPAEGALSQACFLHDIRDPNSIKATPIERSGRGSDDSLAGQSLMNPGVAHMRNHCSGLFYRSTNVL